MTPGYSNNKILRGVNLGVSIIQKQLENILIFIGIVAVFSNLALADSQNAPEKPEASRAVLKSKAEYKPPNVIPLSQAPNFAKIFSSIQPHKEAFWKKPKAYRRITSRRDILVSVKQEKRKNDPNFKHQLTMNGAGLMSAPIQFAYQLAKDFKNLERMSSLIKESRYDSARQHLYFHGEAFNLHARLLLKIDLPDKTPSASHPEGIRWYVVAGFFQGMRGMIHFQDYKRRKTLVSLQAEFPFNELALPDFFVKFGLEVVLQKVAARMRAYTEGAYQKSLNGKVKKGQNYDK